MKYNKIFHTLALAIILSLLMIAIPAAPVLAAATLTVSPTKVEIGDTISVTGSGYTYTPTPPGVTVYIFISSQELDVGDDIEDLDVYYRTSTTSGTTSEGNPGEINKSFNIPSSLTAGAEDEDVHPGTYYVYTTYTATGNIVAKDDFTVRGIVLDTIKGKVGTEVEIQGVGYDAREKISLSYGGTTLPIESGDVETDSRGEFTCTAIILENTAGAHDLIAEDKSNNEGKAVFTVEPALTISLTSGIVGDSVTVNGTGFGNKKDVTITFGNTDVATDETSNKGSFEATFNVPSVGPGTYDVKAKDVSNNTASAKFTIATSISISPTTSQASPGHVGSEITISGTGFKASSQITITYTTTPIVVATPTSDDKGAFSATFTIPPSSAGTHTITASDGTSSMNVTFVMESAAPPIPPPLLPMMGDKAKALAYFDWEDVTDDSMPVTYTLQIASDADFATILVNKTGLTTSAYTLTEAEKLESTKKEAPYYWHVRAVDAASNASEWTGAGTFYVGFIFGFPELTGWVLYGLIGAGVLLLFFLGFWAGRKSKGGGYEEY